MSIDDAQTPLEKEPTVTRRGGFTLVEVLVVIMIIAMLAALVTPAVMRSLSSAKVAAVKTEIDLLHMALMNYKNEYGAFPPADMRGLWNDNTDRVVPSHPAYKHLQRIFPRINEVTTDVATNGQASPYYWMAQMSPAQAMVFWLEGFFDSPQYPLTNGGVTLSMTTPRAGTAIANRKKLFDFDESRLYAAAGGVTTPPTRGYWDIDAPFAPPSPQKFFSRNAAPSAFARDYPVYFPNQAGAGLPYVYFSSSNYSNSPTGSVTSTIGPGMSPDVFYTATSVNGDNSKVAPYFNSENCSILIPATPQFSWAQLHMNADTFQLIAAGADGTYGDLASAFPANVSLSFNGFAHGPFPSVQDKMIFTTTPPPPSNPGHEDNITNFADGRLKDAAEKLLKQ